MLARKVLYVEDELITRMALEADLRPLVEMVILAKNGQEGLDRFREETPDLILTDLRMPIMDGKEMIREIRRLNADIPIIAFTAFDDDVEGLGVDGIIRKPVSSVKLRKMVTSFLEKLAN